MGLNLKGTPNCNRTGPEPRMMPSFWMSQLRAGIVKKKPEVLLSGEVELDEL